MKARRLMTAFLWVLLVSAGTSMAYVEIGDRANASGLIGATIYGNPPAAEDFTLTDQHGMPFRMADTRGKVVVVTFIFTHCTDECPFLSVKLKEAYALLGSDARNVSIVAVTTDPARDTPEAIAAYSREVGLFDAWHFVTGPLSSVRPVWQGYLADVSAASEHHYESGSTAQEAVSEEYAKGLSEKDRSLAQTVARQFGGGYDVSHATAFKIIDRSGRIRVDLDESATPSDIVTDVRSLLSE